jgi:cystathionine beta-lyase
VNAAPLSADEQIAQLSAQRTSAKWRMYPRDVLPAWVAEMDYPVAEPIRAALGSAIANSDLGYRWPEEVPTALAAFAQQTWQWSIDPEWVFVTPDVMHGVVTVLQACTRASDSVVINPPVYPPFALCVEQVAGRHLMTVPLLESEDGSWNIDFTALEQAFARPEVTAYLLCSPHNPTGQVYSDQDLRRIAQLALDHDVLVIADEIHAPLVHPDVQFTPFLTVAPAELAAVSVISASKGWNVPGVKCAQIIAHDGRTADALRASSVIEVSFGVDHLGVLAALAAYRQGGAWLLDIRQRIAANAQLLAELLAQQLPTVRYRVPEASYLAWLDLRNCDLGDDPAVQILERGRLALYSGPAFGAAGIGHARLNFATSPEILTDMVKRLATVL